MEVLHLTCPNTGGLFEVGAVSSVESFVDLCAQLKFVPIKCSSCGEVHRCHAGNVPAHSDVMVGGCSK